MRDDAAVARESHKLSVAGSTPARAIFPGVEEEK